MTAKTFTWPLDLDGFSGDFEQAISAIKFGDGYEQRRTSNINSKVQKWTVQKTGKAAALAPIKAFLEGVGGLESFLWTPKNNTQISVVVDGGSYKETSKGAGVYQLSWTFRQVFE